MTLDLAFFGISVGRILLVFIILLVAFLWVPLLIYKICTFGLLLCREIKILKRLDHHNVIRLIETFEDPEKQKLYPLAPVL